MISTPFVDSPDPDIENQGVQPAAFGLVTTLGELYRNGGFAELVEEHRATLSRP
jgi:hypothetical protein